MANIKFLNGQNITGNVTIATTGVTDNLLLTSTDASASSAPDIVLFRNVAVADSDTLGVLEYRGKNGMVPGSATPLTYNALYSRMVDASNNQSMLSINSNKGNGSGAYVQALHIAAIGANNSATGAILINPSSDFSLPAYNLDVNGDAYISSDVLINGDLSLDNIANATSDTDQFVVSDNGVIKYRTGAEVLSDIGAAPASGGGYLPLTGGRMTTTAKIEFYNASQYIYANSTNDLTLASGDDINFQTNYARFFNAGVESARLSATTNSWIANGSNSKLGVNRTDPGFNLDVEGTFRTTGAATIEGNATVEGNTFLGNANGDYVHVNDKLYVGATDSGNAEFWFGEGSTGDVNYGARWYWDSGYTHQWFTVNNSTETLMMSYATNDLTKVQWFRNFDMNDNKIINLATPTSAADATTKAYVDAAVAGGGSGNITGTGVAGRVAIWDSTTNITNDIDFTFDGADLSLGTQAGTTQTRLLLYGTAANNGAAVIKTTNGNLHIDADDTHNIYLGYYTGANVGIGTGNGGNSDTWFYGTGDVTIGDELTITTIANETSAAGKFLVPNSNGKVKYRTAAEVLSDIGAGTGDGNVTTGGFISGRIPFANSSVNLDNSADLAWDDTNKKLVIGQPTSQGASGTVIATDGRIYIEDPGTNWDVTTPGTGQGSLHFDPQPPATDNIGNAITFGASDSGSGTTAHAGIYTRSDGSFGTKMYLATTDSYATGSKTAITIEHSGSVTINRSHLTISTITNSSSDTDKFLVSNGGQVQYRTGDQVRSDIDAGRVDSVTSGNTSTITVGGTPADPTVAANTGTVNSSSANLATGAQIQTAIDAATTGALKFVSEWDASGLNGGSPDLRLSATHIPGNYYIVSVAGGSTPNGSGTTPNEWAVGDWCIRADLATDTWQKIDNTQVGNVTGSGSFGQLAYWNSNSNITSESRLTFTSYGMSGRLLSVDGSINATDRVNVTGSSTDLYFYEGSRTGTGVTFRLYDNSTNQYFDGYKGIYLRANQIGGSGGTIGLSGGNVTMSNDLTVSGGDITLGGTGRIQGVDTVSASTDAANKAYVDAHGGGVGPFLTVANPTFTGTLTGPTVRITSGLSVDGAMLAGNTFSDPDLVLTVLDTDTTQSIRDKISDNSVLTKVSDSTAPAPGVFEVDGSFYPQGFGPFYTIDEGDTFTFEFWYKFHSGAATYNLLYAGSNFYNAAGTYLGNSQRYWGESSLNINANSGSDWYHVSGTLGPNRGSGNGDIPTTAVSMRLLFLFNYAANGTAVTRYCGLKVYKSGKTVTQLYRKTLGSEAGTTQNRDLVVDANGDLYGSNLTITGNLIGNTSNTTELGTYSTGAIKRIRMCQGGELHFGDTTTSAPLGITEGNWNDFGDQDRLSIYGRSSIKFYAGATAATLSATLQSTGLTLNTITNAASDTDKFLVSDSGIVKYRTGAQVLSDIGGAPATGGAYLPLAGGTMSGKITGKTAGNSSANLPALEVVASGTANTQASIAIQQKTSEGDTIIFADYEPHVEWGISTENGANLIHFTGGTSAGGMGSKTFYNNSGNARTAYIKFEHNTTDGNTKVGGTFYTAGNATFAGKITTTSTATGAIELNGGTGVSTTAAFILRQNGDGAGNGMAITSSHATSHRIWKDANGVLNIGSSGNTDAFKQDITGNVTIAGDLTVTGGDITLGGTGRIQGVDTVSAGTDAANKTYVDNAVAGSPQGTVTGSGVTNYIPKWLNTGTLGNSVMSTDGTNMFFNNGDIYMATDNAHAIYRTRGVYFGWATGYGVQNSHAIMSNQSGSFSDNFTWNSYANIRINIDSNNNDNASTFSIGHHEVNSSTSPLLNLTEGGNLTCSGSFAAGGSSNTFAGSVRIGGGTSNNLLSINGSHSTARMNIYYAGSIDAYNAYIDMWASEPGVTYNGSGIGSNINGSPYYGRKVAAQGQTYIRFINGQFEIYTGTNSSGTSSTAARRFYVDDGGNTTVQGTITQTLNGLNTFNGRLRLTGTPNNDGLTIDAVTTGNPVLSFTNANNGFLGSIKGDALVDGLILTSGASNDALIVQKNASISLPAYTSTSYKTSITSINPIQNFYPSSGNGSDTTTDLGVDQSGNLVRTTQEATWRLTAAQVNAITTSTNGVTLLSAPGTSNLFVIVEKITFMIEYSYNGSQMSGTQQYQIKQNGNQSDIIAVMRGDKVNDIVYQGGNVSNYGIYEHDNGYASLNRTYLPNTSVVIRRSTTSALPTSVSKMFIKMRYRVYDAVTF